MPWPTTSRQSRGYGAAWERLRLRILKRDKYLCQCRHCRAEHRTTPADQVDHIVPKARAKAMGWTNAQIDDELNLQAINSACHERKNLEDLGVEPRERIVIGVDGYPVPHKGGGVVR